MILFSSSRLDSSLLCCSSLKAAKTAMSAITSPITIMTVAMIANWVELSLFQGKVIIPQIHKYINNHLYATNKKDVNNEYTI